MRPSSVTSWATLESASPSPRVCVVMLACMHVYHCGCAVEEMMRVPDVDLSGKCQSQGASFHLHILTSQYSCMYAPQRSSTLPSSTNNQVNFLFFFQLLFFYIEAILRISSFVWILSRKSAKSFVLFHFCLLASLSL